MYFFRNLFIQLSVFLKILSYLCILLVVSSASAISFDNSNYSLIYNPNSFCQGPDESLIVSDLITGVYLIRYSNVIPLHINESFRLPAASILNEKSLFIADYRNNRIVEVNLENGEPKDVWVHPLMQDPEGITVDRNENFYIASYGNGKILKFNKSGELLSEWNGTSEFPLIHPHGIFYHNESIYVTELAGNPKIIKFDSYGNIQQIFGDGGILKYPTSVWVSDDGIFVSDAVDHNIKIFYHNGNLNKTIGSFGSGSGEFFYPYGVGLSGSGEIYVADTHNQRIQIFSQDGEFISIMSPHCIIEKYDKKTNFHEEKLPYKITQNTGEYGSKTETETILLSQKNGTLSVFNQSNFKQITTGLIYPYEFLANKNGYYILDEPGSIQIIDQNGTVITNIALTNIQFDPTNPINSWVYRPHSFDFIQNGLIIANSVPGTISFLSNYGDLVASLTPSTDLTNCSVRHIPASIKCINDTHCIIVDIGSNEIIQLNTSGYQAEKLYFPIPIDYPSKVITSKDNPLVAIIEKLKIGFIFMIHQIIHISDLFQIKQFLN